MDKILSSLAGFGAGLEKPTEFKIKPLRKSPFSALSPSFLSSPATCGFMNAQPRKNSELPGIGYPI